MIQLSTMMLNVLSKARKIKDPHRVFIGKQLNSFASGYKLYGSFFSTHAQSEILLGKLSESYQKKMK